MTTSECLALSESALSAPSFLSEIETDKKYTDVFIKDISTGVLDCRAGFDIRYQRRAHSPEGEGRYPTLVDFRNLFTVGMDYGKQRAMGIRSRWNPVFSNSIGGYPKGSVVRDSSGKKYISRIENNTNTLPTNGESNSWWNRLLPTPKFVGNDINTHAFGPNYEKTPKTTIAFIKLDEELPTEPVTTKMKIASFSGAQLSSDMNGGTFECSGMVVFSNTVCWGPLDILAPSLRRKGWLAASYWGIYSTDFTIERGSQFVKFSYSLKLSPYPDLYSNPEHENEFIEVLSGYRIPMKDGNITRMGDFRSPAKAVPIRKDKMYYLYIEYENGMMVPLDRQPQIPSPTYLEVYPFTRAIELPSAK